MDASPNRTSPLTKWVLFYTGDCLGLLLVVALISTYLLV
jgi:hypothetical protein